MTELFLGLKRSGSAVRLSQEALGVVDPSQEARTSLNYIFRF